jgi:vacuolar-type H+-ATPase subunit C/Vma6
MNIELMSNTLYKAYLEEFYKFCQVFAMHMVFDISLDFIGVLFSYSIIDVLYCKIFALI